MRLWNRYRETLIDSSRGDIHSLAVAADNSMLITTAQRQADMHGVHAGTYCLSGSRDRTVRLWNPYKGTLINSYRGHSGDVRGLAVAADNSTFISAGEDRHINLWDVATSSTIRRMHGHEAAVNDVRHAGTESLLVSASYDSLVAFWDLKGRGTRALQTIKVATDAVTRLAISELGPYVFAASTDGSVTTVDIRKGVLVTDQLHVPVTGIAAPEDGIYVLAACTDSTLRLVDRGSGRVLVSYVGHEHSSFLVECTFLFNGAVAAAGSENGMPVSFV
jgi:mitogen-activated protein kinase organizer 1